MRPFLKIIAGLAAGLLALQSAQSWAAPKENWTAKVSVQADGTHVLGNPDAKLQLTEFVSYTCPLCGAFQRSADAPLRLAYVMPGTLSVRIQQVVRNPVDLAVALLIGCGNPAGYFKRHQIFLHKQDSWLARLDSMSSAQKSRWSAGNVASGLRAISADFGFYQIMDHLNYSRSAVDRCLGDMQTAEKLMAQSADAELLGIQGTPSFTLNGKLLENTHDWNTLNAAIISRMQP